jgi:hypothetical protein
VEWLYSFICKVETQSINIFALFSLQNISGVLFAWMPLQLIHHIFRLRMIIVSASIDRMFANAWQ